MDKSSYAGAWLQFLDKVNVAKEKLKLERNEECFYRGHAQTDWELCPGLLRGATPYNDKLINRQLWEVECDLYYEFRSRARVLHHQNVSDWDVLFSMQHHLVKTRLLDWTEMLGVAIYFALSDCSRDGHTNGSTPCIWLMNPYRLNELYHDSRDLWDPENLDYYDDDSEETYSDLLLGIHEEEGGKMFYWDEPIALYPLRKDDRLTNQGGYFTIHGNNILPMERLGDSGEFLQMVELPSEAVLGAFDFIEAAGINDFTMFPDLDGLAKFLNCKYFK